MLMLLGLEVPKQERLAAAVDHGLSSITSI